MAEDFKRKNCTIKIKIHCSPSATASMGIDCQCPKYPHSLMQTGGALPRASICKGEDHNFILNVHCKKHAQISWMNFLVQLCVVSEKLQTHKGKVYYTLVSVAE